MSFTRPSVQVFIFCTFLSKAFAFADCPVAYQRGVMVESGFFFNAVESEFKSGWNFVHGNVMTYSVSESVNFTNGATLVLLASATSDKGEQVIVRMQDHRNIEFELFTKYGQFGVRGSGLPETMFANAYMYPRHERDRIDTYTLRTNGNKLFLRAINSNGHYMQQDAEITASLRNLAFENYFTVSFGSNSFHGVFAKMFMSPTFEGDFLLEDVVHGMYNYTQTHQEFRDAWYAFDGSLDNYDDMDGYAAQSTAEYDFIPGRLESLQAVRVDDTPLQITHPANLNWESDWTISTWLRPSVPARFHVTDPRPMYVTYERLDIGTLDLTPLHAREILDIAVVSGECEVTYYPNMARWSAEAVEKIMVMLVEADSCTDCLMPTQAKIGGILLVGNLDISPCSDSDMRLEFPVARVTEDTQDASFANLFGEDETFENVLESKLRKYYDANITNLQERTKWYESEPVRFYMSAQESSGFATIGRCDGCDGRHQYNQSSESAAIDIAYFARIGMRVRATNHHLIFEIGEETFEVPYLVHEWVNLAITYDGTGTVGVYVNGQSVQNITNVVISQPNDRMDINFTNTDLDDIRIYEKMFDQTDVVQLPVMCPRGEQGFGGSNCVPCTRGTYKVSTGNEECVACAENETTIEEGAHDVSACVCKPGYRNVLHKCQLVPSNYFRSQDRQLPEKCPDHSQSTAGASRLEDCICEHGFELNVDTSQCDQCPLGKFNSAPGESCTICMALNQARECEQDNSQGPFECTRLCTGAPGFQVNSQGDRLMPCPIGTYNTENAVNCTLCASGHSTTKTGSTSSYDCTCDVGHTFYGLPLSSQTCVPCGFNTFKNVKGVQACTDCEDTERSDVGQAKCECVTARYRNTTTNKCEGCPVDTYKDVVGDHLCTRCAENATTNGTDTQEACFCMPGYYGTEEGLCVACGIRSYKRNVGNYSCLECKDPHHTTLEIGSTSIQQCVCMPGYEPGPSPHTCQACNISFYKNHSGNDACTPCSAAFVTMQTGATACACAPGQYKDTDGQCKPCEIGFYKLDVGDGNCTECPVNTGTQAPGSVVCHCRPGFQNVNGGPCTACPEDQYKVGYGNYTCQECPDRESTFGIAGSESCSCMTGSIRNTNLSQSCVCDRGYEVQLYKKQKVVSAIGPVIFTWVEHSAGGKLVTLNPLHKMIQYIDEHWVFNQANEDSAAHLYNILNALMTWGTGDFYHKLDSDLDGVTRACAEACLRDTFPLLQNNALYPLDTATFNKEVFGDGYGVQGTCQYFHIANIRYLGDATPWGSNFGSIVSKMQTDQNIVNQDIYLCEPRIMPEITNPVEFKPLSIFDEIYQDRQYKVGNTNFSTDPCAKCAPEFEKPYISNQDRCTACGFAEHVDPVTQACTCNAGRERNAEQNNTCECSPGFGNQSATAPGGNCTVCPRDFFRAGIADGPCLPCPNHSNTSGTTGNQECTCEEGYIMYEAACACHPGYTQSDMGTCIPCEAGKFKGVHGIQPCTDCGENVYSGQGALVCTQCPLHTVAPPASTSEDACRCPDGQYYTPVEYSVNDQKTCSTMLEEYTWTHCDQALVYEQTCSRVAECLGYSCWSGTMVLCQYAPDRNDDSEPIFTEKTGGTCDACLAGQYVSSEGRGCDACPLNSNSPELSTTATACTCNMGYSGPDGEECVACPAGTYKDTTGSSDCTACAADQTSSAASISEDACVCYRGYGSSGITYQRQLGKECYDFEYQHETIQDCGDSDFQTAQNECNTNDNCYGIFCHRFLPPTPKWVICTSNFFNAQWSGEVSYVKEDPKCIPCAAGTYKDTGDSVCTSCPSSATSPEASTNIQNCTCDPGFTGEDGTACTACPAGKYKAESGSAVCSDCDAGKYLSQTNSTTASDCIACLDGSTSGVGSTTETDCLCSAGTYYPTTKFAAPIRTKNNVCPDDKTVYGGEWDKDNAMSFCDSEPLCTGFWQIITNHDLSCSSDYASVQKTNGYRWCPVAMTFDEPSTYPCHLIYRKILQCQDCPTGSSSSHGAVGPGNCTCLAGYGTTDNSGGTSCEQCVENTYKSTDGNFECTSCPSSSTSPPGSTLLQDCRCKVGYTGPDGGPCTACPAGKYKAESGSAACTDCDAGKYSSTLALTTEAECDTCPSNSGSASGSTSLEQCQCFAGYGFNIVLNECTQCEVGKYKSDTGNTECTSCPASSTSPLESTSLFECTCNAGFTGEDGTACIACEAGKYKPNTGSGDCTDCPAASYSTESAATSVDVCDQCEAGKYLDISQSSSSIVCVSCPTHSFSPSASDSSDDCVCNSGYYYNSDSSYVLSTTKFCYETDKLIADDCTESSIETAKQTCDDRNEAEVYTLCWGFMCYDNKIYECWSGIINGQHQQYPLYYALTPPGCQSCLENTYKASIGNELELCTACPSNSISPSKSDAIQDCVCNIGYTGSNGGTCTACPDNTYKESVGSELCTSCPASTVTDAEGSDSASDCVARPVCTRTGYIIGDWTYSVLYGADDQQPNFEHSCPPDEKDGYSVIQDIEGSFHVYCISFAECTEYSPCTWIPSSTAVTTIYDSTKVPAGTTCE